MVTTFNKRVGDVIRVEARFNGKYEGVVSWTNTDNTVVRVEIDESDPQRQRAQYVCLAPGSAHQAATVDADLLPTSRRDVVAESNVIVLPAVTSEATAGEIVEV